jgi:hypothetical protein
MPRFGLGDVAIAAPSAPALADRTACPGSPAMADLHRSGWVVELQTGCPVCRSPSCRPAPSRTSSTRRRAPRLRSCVAAVPASKARPDSGHVAVVLALGRAPSSAVDDEAGALSSSILLPRGALPFEGFSSPAAVPRHRGRCPLARRPCVHPATRVATRDGVGAARRPQGLAPLSSSLPSSMLPSRATRSFLGLAYLQDFSPVSRMRNVVLVLTRCRVRLGWTSAPKRGPFALTVTTGLAKRRRSASSPTSAGPSPGAEAPRSGQSCRRPETNLCSWAMTSSGASRRSSYGALDDLPPLPTGSRGHRRTPGTGVRESQGSGRPSVDRPDLRAPFGRSLGAPLALGAPKRSWSRGSCG